MELWIRSQDKRQLLKVNDGLYIVNGFIDTDDIFIGIKNVGHIGRYTKEERALEILDEIQNIISGKTILKSFNNVTSNFNDKVIIEPCEVIIEQLNTYVYEMPKE